MTVLCDSALLTAGSWHRCILLCTDMRGLMYIKSRLSSNTTDCLRAAAAGGGDHRRHAASRFHHLRGREGGPAALVAAAAQGRGRGLGAAGGAKAGACGAHIGQAVSSNHLPAQVNPQQQP